MRCNTLSDHDDVYAIPELMINDKPLWLGVTSLGVDRNKYDEYREQFAYTFATGPYDADVQLQGEDVHGPAVGRSEPGEMAAVIMGFYSAYAEGDLTETENGMLLTYDGSEIALGDTAQFISDNGERFGFAESELENGYIEWSDEPIYNPDLDLTVTHAVQTGKTDE